MKNLVKVIISGMATGIAFLMLGYVGVYYVSGEAVFVEEIALLGEIQTLQSQLLITGISGILLALSMYYIEKIMSQENPKDYKVVLGVILLTVSAIIAMMLIDNMSINISDMLVVFSAILVCAYALFNCIRTLFKDLISRINKKKEEKKEKDIQEAEKGNS